MPDKNNPIRSKLTTRTCWSREEKKERCEANKVFVQSDFGTKCKLKYSLPAWASNLIVVTNLCPRVEVNNSTNTLTIESHLSVEAKEKLGTKDSQCLLLFEANHWLTNQL